MRKAFLFSVLMVATVITQAQINLVPNAGFDTLTACPPGPSSTLSVATPWFSGNHRPTGVHNACATDLGFSVPYSIRTYQPALSGSGYSKLGVYYSGLGGTPGQRDFLQVKLRDTLRSGRQYFLQLYTNPEYDIQFNSNNVFIKNIGLAFSSKRDNEWNENDQFPGLTPALENKGGLITDTANWTRISGCYNVQGNEEYLLVGNFQRPENTQVQHVGTATPYNAFYFFENIGVYEFDPLPDTIYVCAGQTRTLNARFLDASYRWSDGSMDSTLKVTQSGLYKVQVSIGDCTLDDSVRVIVPDELPATQGASVCVGGRPALLNAPISGTYRWDNGQTTRNRTVSRPGIYTVTAQNECGSFSFSYNISEEQCDCDIFVPSGFTPNNDGLRPC